MAVFKKTLSALAFILFYFDRLKPDLQWHKHGHFLGLPHLDDPTAWLGGLGRQGRGKQNRKGTYLLLATLLQQLKLTACWQTVISQGL